MVRSMEAQVVAAVIDRTITIINHSSCLSICVLDVATNSSDKGKGLRNVELSRNKTSIRHMGEGQGVCCVSEQGMSCRALTLGVALGMEKKNRD